MAGGLADVWLIALLNPDARRHSTLQLQCTATLTILKVQCKDIVIALCMQYANTATRQHPSPASTVLYSGLYTVLDSTLYTVLYT